MYTSCVRERYLFKRNVDAFQQWISWMKFFFFLRISGNLYLNSELSLHAYTFNSPNWGYLNSKKLELKKKMLDKIIKQKDIYVQNGIKDDVWTETVSTPRKLSNPVPSLDREFWSTHCSPRCGFNKVEEPAEKVNGPSATDGGRSRSSLARESKN